MKQWQIPAKTFLLGEYAALAGASAMVLTTSPYFELSLTNDGLLHGIHPQSPAGIWRQQALPADIGLKWVDPYGGRGGLGASSAQFLACYWAGCWLNDTAYDNEALLDAYYQCAWKGVGVKPSGYDLLAQTQQGCVYINRQQQVIKNYAWPFADLSFLLLHTGIKLATHQHLQEITVPLDVTRLSACVEEAQRAFEQSDSQAIIACVNAYQQLLTEYQLIASHSLEWIKTLETLPEVLAIKGCGALGADVVLILCSRDNSHALQTKLRAQGVLLLATEAQLTRNIKNNQQNT